MKTIKFYQFVLVLFMALGLYSFGQRGYYDAPFKRYEANGGILTGGAVATSKSYNQPDIQFEASDKVCVNMSSGGAVQWKVSEPFKGIVFRYSIMINTSDIFNHFQNVSAQANLYINNNLVTTLDLNTYYSWEMLSKNGNPNNGGVQNNNWRMRFDEVRHLLSQSYPAGTTIRLERTSGNLYLDFIEIEDVPNPISAPVGSVTYSGDKNSRTAIQSFIDSNGGKVLFFPQGTYNVGGTLEVNVDNTTLQGAGMWYTNFHFTSTTANQGGLWGYKKANFKDLYLTTAQRSRSNAYKAINGAFGNGSIVENIWAEHFECGAWIANYNPGWGNQEADNLTIRHCRFRNNYADGVNLCKGTKNSLVEHCHFRNNGDDDMAMWSANNQECYNNTFQFSTAEHCWRASSCALYGGHGNVWKNIVVKDNYEVGIRVNNQFPGTGFQNGTQNEMFNIDVMGCGVWDDVYNQPKGAIDLYVGNVAGTEVKNVKFSSINIIDSNADAVTIIKGSGTSFNAISFEGITVEGTGLNNSTPNSSWGNGCGFRFVNNPSGTIEYCNLSYSNISGQELNTFGKGTLNWNLKTSCSVNGPTYDTIYLMKDGAILNQFRINIDMDEIQFYPPN